MYSLEILKALKEQDLYINRFGLLYAKGEGHKALCLCDTGEWIESSYENSELHHVFDEADLDALIAEAQEE